jgi:hypothetical protein
MINVLAAIAKSWEPSWAGVYSLDSMNARDFNAAIPFVDWMVYVSDKTCRVHAVPEPSLVQRVDGFGSIVVVQDDPVQPGNPIHLDRVRVVEMALEMKS